MTAFTTNFPLGNADTMRIDLANSQKILIDFADPGEINTKEDNRCELAKLLRDDLQRTSRDYFDAVCITHLDEDHCRRFSEFFYLEHAQKYQTEGRIKIKDLWVPAAAILETNIDDTDAKVVRAEARYRLEKGEGIKIFSQPKMLEQWCDEKKIDMKKIRHLIVDAGETVPGFNKKGNEQVEFFVHSPFAWRQDERKEVDRNEDSIVMQATFLEGDTETNLFMGSDIDHKTLTSIVELTEKNNNGERLKWDMIKLPHHCSYTTLGPERGDDVTQPTTVVKRFFEEYRRKASVIVSSSDQIPVKGTKEDESKQPPHRQAANYYKGISKDDGGEFIVTMENPNKNKPVPTRYKITIQGLAAVVTVPTSTSHATDKPSRAG